MRIKLAHCFDQQYESDSTARQARLGGAPLSHPTTHEVWLPYTPLLKSTPQNGLHTSFNHSNQILQLHILSLDHEGHTRDYLDCLPLSTTKNFFLSHLVLLNWVAFLGDETVLVEPRHKVAI